MKNKRLEERRKRIPQSVETYVKRSFDIVDRIHEILISQGKDQKELAKALGKKESEISKWMTGTHNFTLKTLAKIEEVLGEQIIYITMPKKKTERPIFNVYKQDFLMDASNNIINVKGFNTVIKSNSKYSVNALD
ncbi:MAG: helix-turn-helix transcriptional regulator [Bacteroidales bacterium]|jgi:transcriptional regulator with XRE-family HTH domain|nr:helix-turn-helix transcriptional regulator [Bacteroidales bacterium]